MKYHLATVCLGSNAEDAPLRIARALLLLDEEGWYFLAMTPTYQTSSPYSNCLAYAAFADDYDYANQTAKRVERALGRTPESKAAGIVPIDIDIVVYEHTIMRPSDYKSAYFQEGLSMLEKELPDPDSHMM